MLGEPPSPKAKLKDIEVKIEFRISELTLFCDNLKCTQYHQNNIKALLEEAAGLGWDLSATSSKIPLSIPLQVSGFHFLCVINMSVTSENFYLINFAM